MIKQTCPLPITFIDLQEYRHKFYLSFTYRQESIAKLKGFGKIPSLKKVK